VCLALILPLVAHGARLQDNLYGVKTLESERAWVVGNFGSIHRTDDGGKSWKAQESGTKLPLFSVDFADAVHGWVVGTSGLILQTNDGGGTWTKTESPVPGHKHLFKVTTIDARTAWAVGDWGAITVTRDGGHTWENRSLGILTVAVDKSPERSLHLLTDDVILNDVMFVDRQHGFITGEFGTLYSTKDGGETWRKLPTGTEKTLFGVHFKDPRHGWLVGIDGIVLRTADGGESWKVQRGLVETGAIGDLSFVEAMANPGLYAVRVRGQQGVVVGDAGLLLVSVDGGHSWQPRVLPDRNRLTWMRDVSLGGGAQGLLVGAGGFTASIDRDTIVLRDGHRITGAR